MPASRARLTLDLNALAANYALFKAMAGGSEVAPVVKADAYGLGAGPVAKRLWTEGARGFFVARLEEGEALRAALGPDRPAAIHVFDGAPTASAPRLVAADLIPILNSPAQVEVYSAFSRGHGNALPCGLHLDTGMNRLGLRAEELEALAQSPDRLQGLDIRMVMSHLACADQEEHAMNARQAGRFRRARALFPDARASLANSAGVFLGPDYLHDVVRPGIGLYGGGPFGRAHRAIAPVATLEAPILDVRAVAAGETVGYGADFAAERAYRVAIVAAGYADGLLRASWKTGRAWFAGDFRPLLGRVSMDLLAIDVTGCDDAQPGAMVELLGPHVLLDEAAEAAGTVSYEILTRLGERAERLYVGAAG
ncbi:MAG: alr [Caulobacteraceae bacterium]|nr:alr [Caulobacteraceae bacterium]